MKRILAIGMAAMIVMAAGIVLAAGSATINVSATVSGICKFSAGSTNLAFGTLNPDPAAADVPASTTIQFWCTKGVGAPAFSIAGYTLGTNRQMVGGTFAENLNYSIDSLTPDGNANAGPATPRTLTIAGKVYVAGANGYNAVSADSYTESVTVTITP